MSDARLPLVGLVQSLFEGTMYSFVFLWGPTLEEKVADNIPYGVVFSAMMVSIMIGSSIFSALLNAGSSVETVYIGLLLLAMGSMAVCTLQQATGPMVLYSFLVFELCCGIYFPSAGTLRSRLIPEEVRSAVTNIYRIPLNIFVATVLLNVRSRRWFGVLLLTCCAYRCRALKQQRCLRYAPVRSPLRRCV